jgi:LysM repeat protein
VTTLHRIFRFNDLRCNSDFASGNVCSAETEIKSSLCRGVVAEGGDLGPRAFASHATAGVNASGYNHAHANARSGFNGLALRARLPDKSAGGKVFHPMKLAAIFFVALILTWRAALAQTPAPESAKQADAEVGALAKKIDEQNAKIDALSQEILKLEQQISHIRPGVMIGEGTPTPPMPGVTITSSSHPAAGGNTHTVARGETLTSIAKMYKVTVDELQQANHIEDGRKLQAGQTIVIPTASPAAAGSSTPTP